MNFEVRHYDGISTVLELIFQGNKTCRKHVIEQKIQTKFFQTYFSPDKGLGAKTVLAKFDYFDYDFLHDYSEHYARCFTLYQRRCTRVHFFKETFEKSDFLSLLSGEKSNIDADFLNEHYLGFILIKPLPETVYGRTCLKTYDDLNGERSYPVTREYEVNLLGIPLKIKSVAFQEQDHEVAACATTSLWSVFHCTGHIFRHQIPSPVEITKSATSLSPSITRVFPNEGLLIEQIAAAIRSVGLDPLAYEPKSPHVMRANIYAYLRAKLPIILLVHLYDTSTNPFHYMDAHAVTITGYRFKQNAPMAFSHPYAEFCLESNRIGEIYVHDDQLGPFARMEFMDDAISIKGNSYYPLSTSWRDLKGNKGNVIAIPAALVVPLVSTITINFNEILKRVITFNTFLRNNLKLPDHLKWDIYGITRNDFKNLVLYKKIHTKVNNTLHLEIMTSDLPKFIYRATLFDKKEELLDLIFDATDLVQGNIIHTKFEYYEPLCNLIRDICKSPEDIEAYKYTSAWEIIKLFA